MRNFHPDFPTERRSLVAVWITRLGGYYARVPHQGAGVDGNSL